jgi:hypothetical protein
VQHGITTLGGRANTVRIAHIAGEHLELASDILIAPIQPTPRIEGVVENKGAYVVAGANQRLGQMRADEAIGAGDQDFLQADPLAG